MRCLSDGEGGFVYHNQKLIVIYRSYLVTMNIQFTYFLYVEF